MALNKQSLNINFSEGLDLKTDPKQVTPGKFLSLQNTVFIKGGLLQKRNGFGNLVSLPNNSSSYLTTFNDDLTAIGNTFNAYSNNTETWINKGNFQPVSLNTLPLIRNNNDQSQVDAAVSSNNLICSVYTDNPTSGTVYKYAVADSVTGQNLIAPTILPGSAGPGKIFLLGNYFFISYFTGGTTLKYITINIFSLTVSPTATVITNAYYPSPTTSFDGIVTNNTLYFAWDGNGTPGPFVVYISSTLVQSSAVNPAGGAATIIGITADETTSTPTIYIAWYNDSSNIYITALTSTLLTLFSAVSAVTSSTILNVTCSAKNGVCTIFYESSNNYTYDSAIPTHYVGFVTVTQAGVVGTPTILLRSVGLASKSFILNGTEYFLCAYQSPYQPTYFLSDASGNIIAKLAYQNGGGYLAGGTLPFVTVKGSIAQVPYLYKDLIQAVNKDTNVASGTQTAGIYSQTGINLVNFNLTTAGLNTSEIGSDLHLTGGFLWMYDGYLPIEHNFFVYPDSIEATWSASGGSIAAQPDGATNTDAYFYQVTYEWTDNQGNAFRSAPSIPISVTTTGSGTAGSITLNIPTLRLTYKIANPVKIVIYRWSVAQQIYYQTTSISAPVMNSLSVDYVTFVDTNADPTILGNNILYTTGGVVENVGAPSFVAITLFDTRLFGIDSEDQNLLWYSKQVIEATPVEMSDLFTLYVAPNVSAQGNTGPMTAIAPMDDKLIIFKKDAIYYMNGTGPDNTGANSQYSPVTFITSTVGCSNQGSIVFSPAGLMFQSDKGIWLLGRDLNTTYIGAAVENFNSNTVLSALTIPGTNQVRFTLNNGVTLMYDYYYQQWGTFYGIPGISSTLYQGLHTFIDSYGRAFQETPGVYLDGTNPTTVSLKTGWFNLVSLQGYQRVYEFYLLGEYFSPHKLAVSTAYDYSLVPSHQSIISPDNFNANWGEDILWGNITPWGGNKSLEQWRVQTKRQTCQAFQITINEIFDSSYGVQNGVGLTLSGINLRYGAKKSVRPIPAKNAVG